MTRWAVAALMISVWLNGCGPRPLAERERIALESVPYVYGVGERVRASVRVTPERWGEIEGLFAGVQDGVEERRAIREAVTALQRTAAEQLPVGANRGMGDCPPDQIGRLDCLNTTEITTTFLVLLQQRGLMPRHRVMTESVQWVGIIPVHHTAVIEDVSDGSKYAVDPWFRANADGPVIRPLGEWLVLADWVDPSPEALSR